VALKVVTMAELRREQPRRGDRESFAAAPTRAEPGWKRQRLPIDNIR
jgi:hypothetical protein